jgi:hypothetical protein
MKLFVSLALVASVLFSFCSCKESERLKAEYKKSLELNCGENAQYFKVDANDTETLISNVTENAVFEGESLTLNDISKNKRHFFLSFIKSTYLMFVFLKEVTF